MPAADHDHITDTYEAPHSLSLEVSLLLHTTAPPAWHGAVIEAARILSDRYRDDSHVAELHVLALLLFARAHSDSAAPRDIPVADLLTALDVPVPPGEEHPVTSEIRQALAAAHQSDNPFSTPLGQIVTAVADRYNGMLSWYGTSLLHEHGPEGPAPSPLDHAARRLASHLNSYRPQGPIPPAVPAVDDGPLRIEAFQVYLVTRDNLPLLMCTDCGRPLHALAVDGFMVTAECGSQRQHLRDVEAAHVRLALARATGVAPSVQGQHTVADLYIASAAMPREADPRRYNAVLWNQFRGALRAR